MSSLVIEGLAHISKAEIDFGDLTVLVGPQATGKSLLLQIWKLVQDRGEILSTLRESGFTWDTSADFLQHVLGQGWGSAWRPDTRVKVDSTEHRLDRLRRAKASKGRVFYVPAQRTLVLENGWPRLFQQFTPDTPYVVRQFSQTLHGVIAGYTQSQKSPGSAILFPREQRLKAPLRKSLDEAVYHGGKLTLRSNEMRWTLGLDFDGVQLGFMSWSTGQREFSPLLLSLYHLLPAGKIKKRKETEWVVIEEPEMGLHPKAILSVLLIVLDLLSRGYQVVLSTHAPVVLDVIFALHKLQSQKTDGQAARAVLKMFGVSPSKQMLDMANTALDKVYRVFALYFGAEQRVNCQPISGLDPGSSNEIEAGWGGLTGFSSQIAQAAFDL